MAGGFSDQILYTKLSEVTPTSHSIQTLSLWLIHHRKNSQKVVDGWYKEVRKEKRPPKLLTLLYLANDVIQNSRKKWPLYQEQFLGVLEKAFEHMSKYSNEDLLKALKKVITVWKDRSVYDAASIEKIIYAITSNLTTKQLSMFTGDMATTPPRGASVEGDKPQPKATKKREAPETVDSSSSSKESGNDSPVITAASIFANSPRSVEPDPPKTDELLSALKELEEPPSADKDTREKIASFPEAVASPVFLKQITNQDQAEQLYKLVKNSEPVVTEYCSRLSEEINHRKKVQEMLVSYLRTQKEKADKTQELLNNFKERKEKLGQERKEVHKHYNNLPDLEKLPNSEQLPPLPSAGELFNKY